jgi:hypothetical protein
MKLSGTTSRKDDRNAFTRCKNVQLSIFILAVVGIE